MKGVGLVGLLVLVCVLPAKAATRELQTVSGPGFEGTIFTPARVHEDTTPYYYAGHALCVVPREAVLKAESDLPSALAKWTSTESNQPGPNFPRSCPAKNGTNLRFANTKSDPRPDSVIDQYRFLERMASRVSDYKRQYVGVIIDGKKLVLISFVQNYVIHEVSTNWREHWIQILDGDDLIWNVLYDPSTRTFTDWEE